MAQKEWRVPFDEISDPQTITRRNKRLFKEHGEDIHRLEVDKIEDDHGRRVRIYKVRPRKYFDMGKK